jgi:hypothetical protein
MEGLMGIKHPLRVSQHDFDGWKAYKAEIGFVPDPMILRAGELFLNGRSGTRNLGNDEHDLWRALQQNIAGIIEFIDLIVTRDTIPLISYGLTFPMAGNKSIASLLPDQTQSVEIDYAVYHKVKQGALMSLAALDPAGLGHFDGVSREMDAFRYDWNPGLDLGADAPSDAAARLQLEEIERAAPQAARYVLAGLVFNGFAQASLTNHFIQPKRSRFFAGLTVAPDRAGDFSYRAEAELFDAVEARLKNVEAEVQWTGSFPPILPLLIDEEPAPKTVQDLLDRALTFRASRRGRAFRSLWKTAQAQGSKGDIAKDMARAEQRRAAKLLTPYTKKAEGQLVGLEVKISGAAVGVPGIEAAAKTSFKVGVPTWLRVWWNVEVPFGGIRKTLRRMWMSNKRYEDLNVRLRDLWMQS